MDELGEWLRHTAIKMTQEVTLIIFVTIIVLVALSALFLWMEWRGRR